MQLTILGALRRLDHARLRAEFYRGWEVGLRNKLSNAAALQELGPQPAHELEEMRLHLIEQLGKGRPMGVLIKLRPAVFPPMDSALLAAGDQFGSLRDAHRLLSLYYLRDFARMAKVRRWAAIPITLGIVAAFVLPFPLLWDVSSRAYSTAIIASVIGLYGLGGIILSVMFSIAEVTARIARPRFTWALALGLEGGLTFKAALELAAQVSGLGAFGRHVAKFHAKKAKDMRLAEFLDGAPQMWPQMLERAKFCDQTGEYIATLHVFAQSLEPQD